MGYRCVFAVAIPTTELEFRDSIDRGVPGDFASRLCPSWPSYRNHVVEPFADTAPSLRAAGVEVVTRFTFGMLASTLAGQPDVLSLFSHWTGRQIEFYDGLRDVDEVVAATGSYSGVLDLCVCHPEALVVALKHRNRGLTVRYSRSLGIPRYWLQFYRVVYTIMARDATDFVGAVERAVREFGQAVREL